LQYAYDDEDEDVDVDVVEGRQLGNDTSVEDMIPLAVSFFNSRPNTLAYYEHS
jgi:hypothetical protein